MKFEEWLENEFYNDRIELSIKDCDRITQAVGRYCLDKQKVKEEIDELMERYHPKHFGEMDADDFRHLMKQLKKNLGLEDGE